jgi:hypothetical protein
MFRNSSLQVSLILQISLFPNKHQPVLNKASVVYLTHVGLIEHGTAGWRHSFSSRGASFSVSRFRIFVLVLDIVTDEMLKLHPRRNGNKWL